MCFMDTHKESQGLPEQTENPPPMFVEEYRAQLRDDLRCVMSSETERAMGNLYEEYTAFIGREKATYRTRSERDELKYVPCDCTPVRLSAHLWLRPKIHHILDNDYYYVMMHVYDDEKSKETDRFLPAEFNFYEFKPGKFDLSHRLVHPDLRNSGLGKHIVDLITRFVGAAAQLRGKDQKLFLQSAQFQVIEWFERQGFRAKDKRALDQFRTNVENGKYIRVRTPSDEDRDDYVYPAGTPVEEQTGPDSKAAVRIELGKKIAASRNPGES